MLNYEFMGEKEKEFDEYERTKIRENEQEFDSLCESVVEALDKQNKDTATRILVSIMYPYQLKMINNSWGKEAEDRCKESIEELIGKGNNI